MYAELFDPIIKSVKEKSVLKNRNIIAIDGADASGKTFLAKKLLSEMQQSGVASGMVSIDGFHNPREIRYRQGRDSAAGFYEDSYDCESFISKTIMPFLSGRQKILAQSFDLDNDIISAKHLEIPDKYWLIVEGIFLHRPLMRDFWDISLYIDISDELSLERNLRREFSGLKFISDEEKQRFQKRYVEGQKIYRGESQPHKKADFIIDNNDLDNPRLINNKFNKEKL